ncbi:beta-glucosidase BglX [Paenibacillus radicis (ex Gao et al. 2016)]|uniref:Glycosyl hydrolase n=1 Tax=Paenibacillus radicis (ex Gao et al. 2016) TaxID=1737354 RepID=A0A917GZ53_9BACL|nr:beta-glucosidase BglX [Paenibacillus radicis (ex Gao et al. 2016)]GGG62325.1 glycosyl hydrolase [Paenibacillus radicis (ex Gao et al. 2016)]
MIGLWHAMIEGPGMKMKVQFKLAKKSSYTLDVVCAPLPLPLKVTSIEVEGNIVRGVGHVFWSPEESWSVQLAFGEEAFEGELYVPKFGKFPLQGLRGSGPMLSEAIMTQLEPYRRVSPIPERSDEDIRLAVDELLKKLSLEEKIGQMFQCMASNFSFGGAIASDPPEKLVSEGRVGSILGAFDISRVFELQKLAVEQSPHGIPLLFNADIIHGSQTIFPVPLAWSCSWDEEAIRRACAISAKEATASGIIYNHGPMVDVTRDPRWGRVVEGAGEDPYLGSVIAKAQVEGFQGEGLSDPETLIACLKHFIGYGAAEGGRDYNTVDISEGTLRNVYLPPFRAGIQAGAGSVMNAFNLFQGVPVAANRFVLKELLRDELGFDGVLISDYGSIDEIVHHGNAKDNEEAARLAVNATMDIEMVTRSFEALPRLVAEGKLSESQIEEAARRILTLKYKTGIMDDPFRYIRPEKEQEYHFHPDHLMESREIARKSIVLLKNNGVLPMTAGRGKVALIGPFADSRDLLGPWQFSRYEHETVTLYEGLEGKGFGTNQLLYAQGSEVNAPLEGGIEEAVAKAEQADIVVLALGESSSMSGEAASRMSIELPEAQMRLAEAVAALGKPTILVLTNGRPLVLQWFETHPNVHAIVESWFLGSQAGHAIADVLTGGYNPSGRLTMSFPVHGGQVPVYYNHFSTGRPVTAANKQEKYISKYIDGPNDPLYPFGYGLSYTQFAYSDLRLSSDKLSASGELLASITVTNQGKAAGEETVQWYVNDCYGSVVRPVKELKGFQKLALEPGESKEAVLRITSSDLAFWSTGEGEVAENGSFVLFVGPNSRDTLSAEFELHD